MHTNKPQPRVWKKGNPNIPASAVYIGRGGKWGNPYIIGRDGTRSEVIAKYQFWLMHNNPKLVMEARTELKGKDLVCFCAPLPCHGDILLRIAQEPE